MKAIFIAFNQAYNDEIVVLLEKHGQRGFTRWNDILGRGSVDGEPHYGSHAWPVQNMAILEGGNGAIPAEAMARAAEIYGDLTGSRFFLAAMAHTSDESSPPERRNPTFASATSRFSTPSISFSRMFRQAVSISSRQTFLTEATSR